MNTAAVATISSQYSLLKSRGLTVHHTTYCCHIYEIGRHRNYYECQKCKKGTH